MQSEISFALFVKLGARERADLKAIGEDLRLYRAFGSTKRKAHDGHLKALLINLLGHGFSFTSQNSISRHLVSARH